VIGQSATKVTLVKNKPTLKQL